MRLHHRRQFVADTPIFQLAEEACVAALKDAPIVIEAVYRSETVRSNRCWWVDSEFLVVVFGGHHEGTVLVQHVVNKDMS